jgi:hypothetical protein
LLLTNEPERIVRRALAYARCGWPVFPCRPGRKEPATRSGFRDATVDDDQIKYWWERQPDANVAIATGAPGPDVLDVDQHGPAGNGFPAYRQLKTAGLLDGAGAVVATPGGGLHVYFAGSGQACGRLPRLHLDFRANGGYVLAPPSQISGKQYRLLSHRAGSGQLNWPEAADLLNQGRGRSSLLKPAGTADVSRLLRWVEQLKPGNRNCGLFWAACRAAEAGQLESLDDLAVAAAKTGLPHREIAQTIASARRTTARQHKDAA